MDQFDQRILHTLTPGEVGKVWSTFPHHYAMAYIWSFIMNITVFLVLYKYRPAYLIAHYILGFLSGLISLLFTIPILQLNGIIDFYTFNNLRRHFIIGIVILTLIGILLLLGMFSSIMKLFKKSPSLGIFSINAAHKYLGYVLVIFAKFQAYWLIHIDGDHPVLLIIFYVVDAIFFVLFVIQKIKFPTLAETIMPSYEEKAYR